MRKVAKAIYKKRKVSDAEESLAKFVSEYGDRLSSRGEL